MSNIRGRYFTPKFDSRRIDRDIEQHQRAFGTFVEWYFFDPVNSTFDDIYDEGASTSGSGGRRWTGPIPMPVVSANRREGLKSTSDDGQYVLDTIDLRISYEQARRAGLLPEMSHNNELHIRDRFVYDGIVWGVRDISVTGQFEPSGHDTMMRILGVMLRQDELVNDPDFVKYAAVSEDNSMAVWVKNITIECGASFILPLEWTDKKGINVPLAGIYTAEIRFGYVNPDESITTIKVYSTTLAVDGSGITLAPTKDIDVFIAGPATRFFAPWIGEKTLVYDLDLTQIANPNVEIRLMKGAVSVNPEVP